MATPAPAPTDRRRQPRLLAGVTGAGRPLWLADHLRVHGPRPRIGRLGPDTAEGSRARLLLRAVEAVNLRGRGGGGYPLAAKLAAVARGKGRGVVVVNGAESEPAARKDATLLGLAPHLVLDGAALAAELVGAAKVIVWLHHDPGAPPPAVVQAIAERHGAGLGDPEFEVVGGPARYVAGESSAIVNRLSGGPTLPTLAPPHATERGVLGQPTVVSNAETLAHLALLANRGPDWFASVGIPGEAGTLLVTLAGAVHWPGVLEVPFGSLIGGLVEGALPPEPVQALLVGGYAGTWLPWPYAAGLPLSRGHLRRAGAGLGVGLLAVLPVSRCGLVETSHLVRWLAAETAGQCGPCVNGLPAIASALRALADCRADQHTVRQLVRWAGMVAGRGLCHHPDGVVMLVRSALRVFDREVAAHLAGHCLATPLRSLPPLLPLPAGHGSLEDR